MKARPARRLQGPALPLVGQGWTGLAEGTRLSSRAPGTTLGVKAREPSAGIGAIVRPVLKMGATVDAIEIHPDRAAALRGMAHPALKVHCANFLKVTPAPVYDLILMNPPFSGTHFMDHVKHAWDFLAPVVCHDSCASWPLFVLSAQLKRSLPALRARLNPKRTLRRGRSINAKEPSSTNAANGSDGRS